FSLWLATWAGQERPPGVLEISFNNQSLGTFTGPAATGVWQQFGTTWDSGSSSSLAISIIERNRADVETGFALDDISLTGPAAAVPDPPSLLLALAGAALLGWAAPALRRSTLDSRPLTGDNTPTDCA